MEDIYSIGYGNLNIDAFINLLRDFNTTYLVDVRSNPYSKFNPDYTKSYFSKYLKKHDINYVFLGDILGGMPKDKSLYDSNGNIDYSKFAYNLEFQNGLKRIIENLNGDIRICIMCAEKNPQDCHRSKLIGEELFKKNIDIKHILHDSTIIKQTQISSSW